MEAAQSELTHAKERVVAHAKRRWLNDAIDQLLSEPHKGYEFLASRCGHWEHDRSIIEEAIEQTRKLITQAEAEIRDVDRGADLTKTDWEAFKVKHGLASTEPLRRMVYERVFLNAQARQQQQSYEHAWRELERERGSNRAREAATAREVLLQSRRQVGRRQEPKYALEASGQEAERLSAELGAKEVLADQAQAQLAAARSNEAIVATPPNTRGAIGVLVYLALVGVALPSVLLAFEPTALSVAWRVVVVALLVSGVAALAVVIRRGFMDDRNVPYGQTGDRSSYFKRRYR